MGEYNLVRTTRLPTIFPKNKLGDPEDIYNFRSKYRNNLYNVANLNRPEKHQLSFFYEIIILLLIMFK